MRFLFGKKKPVRKILCIRSDRLGEFLLTLPAIRLIKDNYPTAQIALMARQENLDLVRGFSYIDRLLPAPGIDSDPWTRELRRIIKKEAFDAVVIFNPRKKFNLASFFAGIPQRVGYNRKWGFLLNRKIPDIKHLAQHHEIEYNLSLAALICAHNYVPEPDIPWNERSEIQKVLERETAGKCSSYVIVHPFSSDSTKEIDFAFWDTLISKLLLENARIAIIGLRAEYENSRFNELVNKGCINLCGKLSLREMGNLLKFFCSFYIGVDSGPFHMASLLKIPFAALFRRPGNIRRWGSFYVNPRGRVYLYQPGNTRSLIDRIAASVTSQERHADS